jgi:hypothetical protein
MRTMLKLAKNAFSALALVLIASCGGGGSSNPPPPPPAPSALSYPAPAPFTRGTAIATLSPTVTGTVISYSVAPALPAGLALNTGSGVISGTPTAIAAAANYVVTATNASGNTAATLSLSVNDIAPDIAFPGAAQILTTGVPVTLTPTNAGGPATHWSVNQPLPAGLLLNSASGAISGTPVQLSTASTYVLTAQNSGGVDTFDLTIAIQSGVLLELGHATEISQILYEGTRILSLDVSGHASLWNAQSSELLASTTSACDPILCRGLTALAGPTAVVRQVEGLDVFSSATGALIAQIELNGPTYPWWKLSADGNYIVAGTGTEIRVWSRTGTPLFNLAGNYSDADAFAAAGEIRIAKGPAGAAVIETVSVPGAVAASSAPFQGTFYSWFADGERFFSHLGNTVWVYSSGAVQQDLVALPTVEQLGGRGAWMWTADIANLRIYAVGASTAPAAVYPRNSMKVVPSANTIGLLESGEPELSVIDLSGPTPVKNDFTAALARIGSYASTSSADWVFGTISGALSGTLVNGPAVRRYALGQARSITASASRIAVATAAGDILYFDTATRSLLGEIDFQSSQLSMSADGTRLGALANTADAQYHPDRTIRVYELPDETVLAEFPYSYDSIDAFEMSLSLSGTVIAQVIHASGVTTRQALNLDGTPLWSDAAPYSFVARPTTAGRLSPDGSRIAAYVGLDVSGRPYRDTITNIFTGSTLTTAVSGAVVGWIDTNRLLVNRYRPDRGSYVYDRCEIVTPAGEVTACPNLPELHRIQTVSSSSIYSPDRNTIYDLSSGATLWSSVTPNRREGAVAGEHVVFASGATVRIEPR